MWPDRKPQRDRIQATFARNAGCGNVHPEGPCCRADDSTSNPRLPLCASATPRTTCTYNSDRETPDAATSTPKGRAAEPTIRPDILPPSRTPSRERPIPGGPNPLNRVKDACPRCESANRAERRMRQRPPRRAVPQSRLGGTPPPSQTTIATNRSRARAIEPGPQQPLREAPGAATSTPKGRAAEPTTRRAILASFFAPVPHPGPHTPDR